MHLEIKSPSKGLMKRALSSKNLVFLLLFLTSSIIAFGQHSEHPTDKEEFESEEVLKVGDVILEHVKDSYVWHVTKSVVIPLPVIVYSADKGLEVFSSAHLYEHHKPVEYKGYYLKENHLARVDEGRLLDLSITKNVVMLFITTTVLLLVFLSAARKYKQNKGKAPSGIQSFVEPIILFVKDEVAKPNIGPKYEKYLPFLLTLFFFILLGNLLGLLPGAANLTGNIAVTLCMALITFVITNVKGNANYWKHIFWTPGVPLWLRPIMILVEVIGIFTKPFALTVRLFVAITAGHIVILALICLTFIFKSYFVGVGASLFLLFISLIEVLVAGIQAYVFTLFSSLYIGMAIEEHGHDH